MSRKKDHKLHAVVAPKQKKVIIMLGGKVLKRYSFKMDIPNTKITRSVFVHDYGEWCVSARDSVVFKDDVVWDKETINEIKTKALEYYKQTR